MPLRRAEEPDGPNRPVPDWAAPSPPQLGPPRSLSAPVDAALGVVAVGGPAVARVAGGVMSGGLWSGMSSTLVTGERLTSLVRLAIRRDREPRFPLLVARA